MAADDATALEGTMARMLGIENGELANVGISGLLSMCHAYFKLSLDTHSPVPELPQISGLRNRQRSYSTKLSRVCSVLTSHHLLSRIKAVSF